MKQKSSWKRLVIFDGVQIIWTKDIKSPHAGIVSIEITKDRRSSMSSEFPYALHVAGRYEGHYKYLNEAKLEGVKNCG